MRCTSRHLLGALVGLAVCAAALTGTVCAAQRQDAAFSESVVELADALANDIIMDTIEAGAARAAASRPVPSRIDPSPC